MAAARRPADKRPVFFTEREMERYAKYQDKVEGQRQGSYEVVPSYEDPHYGVYVTKRRRKFDEQAPLQQGGKKKPGKGRSGRRATSAKRRASSSKRRTGRS